MRTFDSVLDNDGMEPDIKRAWLMVDNPLMCDNGGGLITLDEYAKRRIKQGLETAENERLTAELAAVRAELAECRQAAFENGRETQEAMTGYGELPF